MQKGKRGRAKTYDTDSLMFRSVMGIILIAFGILAVISIIGGIQGAAFSLVKQIMQGLGGGFCLGIPLFLIWGGILIAFSAHKKAPVRAILFLMLFYLCLLGIINLLSKIGTSTLMEYAVAYNQGIIPPQPTPDGYWAIIKAGYQICGTSSAFGGALGMLTAWPLWTYVNTTGGVAVLCALALICVLFFSRFDFIGSYEQMKANMESRTEQREVNRQAKAIARQMKAEEAPETNASGAESNELEIPAYKRQPNRNPEQPVQIAQNPLAMPGEAVPGFAGVVYAKPAQVAGAMGAAPIRTTLYTVPPSNVSLYDEMIVPEVPEGGQVSNWQLKSAHAQGNDKSATAPEPAQPETPAVRKTRETAKVIERMEDNRRRKDQIQQKINETATAGSLNYGTNAELERILEAARKVAAEGQGALTDKPDPAQAWQQNGGSVGQNQPLNADQIAYAKQTASYQPPINNTPPMTPQNTEGASNQTTDRFGAYRRPNEDPTAQPTMSGQRLDKPNIKIPVQGGKAESPAKVKMPKPYPYPMIELLNLRTQTLPDTRDLDRANAMKLEQTLESFGIPARVQRVTHGPAVTRFELGLVSSGINVKRIMNIADNIALDMAANGGVRIEVPIPGTNLFGVEVPNKEIISVSLAEVLTSPEMTNAKSPLSVALGKDIAGRPIICDLAKMPHLLIAGQTGSGKSVCINSIINSLLYRASPEEVRMIMIDPKVVELQGYNKVPHLLIPVVSDPHKAAGALAWAVQEMLDRYHKMQSKGVREIASYNAKVTGDEPKLPRIVIIIDELSDLMLACKKDVEESIIRLAQLARAAGIHVVVATQRPTVNVITGLIKANIPSRIAFAVASSIDSRTILDMNGAEKLLGKGDMFYYPTGEKAPLRVQGCYLSDSEITNIVDYIGDNSETDYDETITEIMESPDTDDADSAADSATEGDNDERLQEAIEMVLNDGQASISMLQRRMKIGYARAGRLIDEMASRGIVSKSAGSKPREILMSYEQYLQQRDTLLR